MKDQARFEIPISFTDLFGVIMFVFILISIALSTLAQQEYQTQVNLLKKRTEHAGTGMGTEVMSLSIVREEDKYQFALESKKIGQLKLDEISEVLTELKRLHPTELVLRVDKLAEFQYPQEILIAANQEGIQISFAYEEEL